MAGGQSITTQQGSVLVNTGQTVLVGSAVATATGTVSPAALALSGSASTGTAGDLANVRLLRLASRKVGGGSASQVLSGQAVTPTQGDLAFGKGVTAIGISISVRQGTLGPQRVLTGQAITGAQGALLYRGQVTVGWTANTEPDLAGYHVHHGTVSGTWTDTVTVGIVASYVWGGLLPGSTHYFAVSSFDATGNESAKSVIVSKTF